MKDVAVKVKGTTRKYEIIIVTVCADENGMFQRNGSIAAKAAGYEPITSWNLEFTKYAMPSMAKRIANNDYTRV